MCFTNLPNYQTTFFTGLFTGIVTGLVTGLVTGFNLPNFTRFWSKMYICDAGVYRFVNFGHKLQKGGKKRNNFKKMEKSWGGLKKTAGKNLKKL